MWYRRSGAGRRLWAAYYARQLRVELRSEAALADFERIADVPLPTTFRLRRGLDAADAAGVAAAVAGAAAPTGWCDAASPLGSIFQAAAGLDRAALSKGGVGRGDAAAERLARELPARARAAQLCRQEAVSALPVAALRVAPGSRCLDMCASPGSKTMQLLEAVGATGCVFANDADPRRARTLLAALERHGRLGVGGEAPADADSRRSLVVTCHRGEAYPSPRRGRRFDAVLADVPCSGDGTCRKDASVLPRFSPAAANALHATQLAIAWRGLQLLEVGGLMAYSTCSLNPIEDEAVVAALLRRGGGNVALEEWPAEVLPRFRRRGGLRTWGVADVVQGGGEAGTGAERDGEEAGGESDGNDCEDEPRLRWHARGAAAARRAGFKAAVESMWPPTEDEVAAMGLSRCSRVLPGDNDTGGFFVALLRKTGELAGGEEERASTQEGRHSAAAAKLAARGPSGTRELGALRATEVLLPTGEVGASGEAPRAEADTVVLARADGSLFAASSALADFGVGGEGGLCILAAGVPI